MGHTRSAYPWFPQSISLAATFDPELLGRVGEAIGTLPALNPSFAGALLLTRRVGASPDLQASLEPALWRFEIPSL